MAPAADRTDYRCGPNSPETMSSVPRPAQGRRCRHFGRLRAASARTTEWMTEWLGRLSWLFTGRVTGQQHSRGPQINLRAESSLFKPERSRSYRPALYAEQEMAARGRPHLAAVRKAVVEVWMLDLASSR